MGLGASLPGPTHFPWSGQESASVESVEISEFKGFRSELRLQDELILLMELRMWELKRRISFIEASIKSGSRGHLRR